MIEDIKQIIDDATRIVIVQADNPDGDSVASALALEQILHDLGKDPIMYCGVDLMGSHFANLPGWDRTVNTLPNQFDASIVVDCSVSRLFEQLQKTNQFGFLKAKPMIVIDHHDLESDMDFAKVIYNHKGASSTGQVIAEIAQQLKWSLGDVAKRMITSSILSDTLGFTSEMTSPEALRIVADFVEQGLSLAELEDARRSTMRKSLALVQYKGELLQRVQLHGGGRVATIDITWEEIEKYSNQYNPSMLVLDDMRMIEGVEVAIAFKIYQNGRITGKIRCNYGTQIAGVLGEAFNGGGHPYAAGFKELHCSNFPELKQQVITKATELLDDK